MTRPVPVRASIVALAMMLNVVSYTDRACIAVAAPRLREAFQLDAAQMGLVFSIFSLSYFLGQTPWGAAADRYGARWLVAAAVFGWSLFTGLTAVAWSFGSLLAVRFVFGGIEAALSPAIAHAFTRWIPPVERSTAFGLFLAGGRLGGTVAPPLATWILVAAGWRVMFLAFSAAGVVFGAIWWLWYRNEPAEHRFVSEEEARQIGRRAETAPVPAPPIPLRQLLASGPLRALLVVAFGITFPWQFYITWFPTYLLEHRGMTAREVSGWAALPFGLGMMAAWLGGILADMLGRRYGVDRGRMLMAASTLSAAAALLAIGIWTPWARMSALSLALAAGCIDLQLGAAWSAAVSIGGRSGGAVAGLMNAFSNAAGFLSPLLMGWALRQWHDWTVVLMTGAATCAFSALAWRWIVPGGAQAQSSSSGP